ncbi:MAG: AraC family transcriptional regulator [Alphaproteobacteria bacterium]|nr:AraC family transcriptional regulator [Alphaproteobacteria bacterium]
MTADFQFDFYSLKPSETLKLYVESIWFAKGTVPYKQEKIAPTGSVVAIFILGDAIEQTPLLHLESPVQSSTGLLIGPHNAPITNRPLGETHAVGIVATAIGAERLFGIPPASLRGKIVKLLDFWQPAKDLRKQLLSLNNGQEKTRLIEQFLCQNIGKKVVGEQLCSDVVSILEANPKTPIADIAQKMGVENSSLVRTFTRVVGLSPRSLSNLLRMRNVLNRLDVSKEIDWTAISNDNGWFDQAHFIRSFKRHTGHTPTQYVAAQKAFYNANTASGAAGFVPEI